MADFDNPCVRECPDRSPTCHGTCEKYTEWRKQHNRELEERHYLQSLQRTRGKEKRFERYKRRKSRPRKDF